MELFSLFITAIFVNNIVLTKFLGMCPFMGVSRKTSSALGMGGAVTFVTMSSALLTYALYHFVLHPLELQYMELITFILIIASFVQLVEMIIKKFSPTLYRSLGIFLPLITTNCAVLFVALQNIRQGFNLVETVIYSFAVSVGFTLVLIIFSSIRERLDIADVPKPLKGNAVAMIVAAIMALAFSGFAGLV